MTKELIFVIALLSVASASLTRNHDYWYTAGKAAATSGIPLGDTAWGYCDMKCTYLEHYYPTSDFVVITFTESTFKPDFAACYVSTILNGVTSYTPWYKVAKNSYFEDNCGGDKEEDYYALTTGASPKYKVNGPILGVGIGTEIVY